MTEQNALTGTCWGSGKGKEGVWRMGETRGAEGSTLGGGRRGGGD